MRVGGRMDMLCFGELSWKHADRMGAGLPASIRGFARWLYIDPPAASADQLEPVLESWPVCSTPQQCILVAHMVVPRSLQPHFCFGTASIQATYTRLLTELMQREHYANSVIWVQRSTALAFANGLPHQLLIWDRRRTSGGKLIHVEMLQADVLLIRDHTVTEGQA